MKFLITLCVFFGALFGLAACSHHPSHIYSSTDYTERPYKSDSIFLLLPNNATPLEKKVVILLKNELFRNEFNIVPDFQESKWVLSFAVDRDSYSISLPNLNSSSVNENVIPVTSSNTYNVLYTDTALYMHLFKTSELSQNTRPKYIWEGSVATNEHVFDVLPHSTVKNLLDKFGQNFNGSIIVDKDYQKEINKQNSD